MNPNKVKLIVAVTFQHDNQLEFVEQYVTDQFGLIDAKSAIYPFSFTDYYTEEMGTDLSKVLLSFERLISREKLSFCKRQTNLFEIETSHNSKRTVNLDPGYIGEANLVLAGTKNFAHRIYLGEGIFGDCHLVFEEGAFHPLPWTHPDYQEKSILNFLGNIRNSYVKETQQEDASSTDTSVLSYRDAGVDIERGEEAVQRIKARVRKTYGKNVLTDLGKFGGFYAPDWGEFEDPVLVSSVDGVGTKLKVAFAVGIHHTVGNDLVNHCINDILCCGAKPLFFLDYLAFGKLDVDVFEEVVSGMANGCEDSGCALIGGETAEMRGFYREGEYDISGTVVGVVDRKSIIDGTAITKGDVIIGLPSSGLHTNGYSLARKVLFDSAGLDVNARLSGFDVSVGEELLQIHRCYYPALSEIIHEKHIHGLAHITGGGLLGNISRLLEGGLRADLDWNSWEWLPIFKHIQELGSIPDKEMRQIFNLGIGMTLILAPDHTQEVQEQLRQIGLPGIVIGTITAE